LRSSASNRAVVTGGERLYQFDDLTDLTDLLFDRLQPRLKALLHGRRDHVDLGTRQHITLTVRRPP
jgi:hypothetical protein